MTGRVWSWHIDEEAVGLGAGASATAGAGGPSSAGSVVWRLWGSAVEAMTQEVERGAGGLGLTQEHGFASSTQTEKR